MCTKKCSSLVDHHPPDPHILPAFDSTDSVVKPKRTVLYLPPLLSSFDEQAISPNALETKLAQLTEARLPSINAASLALHQALHHFQPITDNYSAEPYHESFNWDDLELPEDVEGEWYIVAFRSRRKAGSEDSPLYEADRDAHAEAVSNGGLIMYWYGTPHPVTRDNMATCIWQSRADAVAAISGPAHVKAARLAASSYEMYTLERYVLRKGKLPFFLLRLICVSSLCPTGPRAYEGAHAPRRFHAYLGIY
ncbi:hypothetical protein DL93DRAFT_2146838 [Clavulina sp. PMI_390]|nr:hypothetical protein DL93DRAFT_2146838 [Clavulina sp. PMI_390]